MPSLNHSQVRQFVAVAEHRNFGRAAEALGLSQQAVSKNVALLEGSLRARLLERGRFGAIPTVYGEALLRRAKSAEAELRLGLEEIEALRGASVGSVRVGVGPAFASRVLPAAMVRMHHEQPAVQIATCVETSAVLYPMLLRGELDFVVSAPPLDLAIDSDISQELLFLDRECLVVRAKHPLARRRQVGLTDLKACTWIVSSQIPSVFARICRELAKAALSPPTRVLRTDATELGRTLLLNTDSVALIGRESIQQDLAARRLVELRVAGLGEAHGAFAATRPRSALQPAASRLLDHVRAVCRELFRDRGNSG